MKLIKDLVNKIGDFPFDEMTIEVRVERYEEDAAVDYDIVVLLWSNDGSLLHDVPHGDSRVDAEEALVAAFVLWLKIEDSIAEMENVSMKEEDVEVVDMPS